MTSTTTKLDSLQPAAEMAVDLFDNWFDPIETEVRARAHEFIEEMIRGELDTVLARPRYSRSQKADETWRVLVQIDTNRGSLILKIPTFDQSIRKIIEACS